MGATLFFGQGFFGSEVVGAAAGVVWSGPARVGVGGVARCNSLCAMARSQVGWVASRRVGGWRVSEVGMGTLVGHQALSALAKDAGGVLIHFFSYEKFFELNWFELSWVCAWVCA